MCEWLNKCPNTGVDIENAPCKAVLSLIDQCREKTLETTESLDDTANKLNKIMEGDGEMLDIIKEMLLADKVKSEWLLTGWELMSIK